MQAWNSSQQTVIAWLFIVLFSSLFFFWPIPTPLQWFGCNDNLRLFSVAAVYWLGCVHFFALSLPLFRRCVCAYWEHVWVCGRLRWCYCMKRFALNVARRALLKRKIFPSDKMHLHLAWRLLFSAAAATSSSAATAACFSCFALLPVYSSLLPCLTLLAFVDGCCWLLLFLFVRILTLAHFLSRLIFMPVNLIR